MNVDIRARSSAWPSAETWRKKSRSGTAPTRASSRSARCGTMAVVKALVTVWPEPPTTVVPPTDQRIRPSIKKGASSCGDLRMKFFGGRAALGSCSCSFCKEVWKSKSMVRDCGALCEIGDFIDTENVLWHGVPHIDSDMETYLKISDHFLWFRNMLIIRIS